jgi:hypothetical protein
VHRQCFLIGSSVGGRRRPSGKRRRMSMKTSNPEPPRWTGLCARRDGQQVDFREHTIAAIVRIFPGPLRRRCRQTSGENRTALRREPRHLHEVVARCVANFGYGFRPIRDPPMNRVGPLRPAFRNADGDDHLVEVHPNPRLVGISRSRRL